MSNDQLVLMAVQSIIQNMLATEDPSQQQLHFLQSCGFGGLWRFAGPFTKVCLCMAFLPQITQSLNWSLNFFVTVQHDG